MGRVGIEPATLGLKVRPHKLRLPARNGNLLQIGQIVTATNQSKMRQAETSLYAHLYTAAAVLSDNNIVSEPGPDRHHCEVAS
jgi:hypothetical protein